MIDKLIILHEYGAPRHFLALYYLQKQGFIKEIQTIEFNLPTQVAKVILHRKTRSLSRCFINIKGLIRLSFVRNQVIIIGAAPYDPIVSFLQKLKQRNKIIYFTSWPFWEGERYAKKPLLPNVRKAWHNFLRGTLTVAVTEVTLKGVVRHGARAFHIPHAVDTQMFTKPPGSPNTATTNILFVGSLTERKGVPLLLNVIREMRWPKDVQFWFVGDGPYRQQVALMEKGYPVKYFGRITDSKKLASVYQRADIFVLPSIDFSHGNDIENFGIVLIEAMASGLPIVTTDCVGPKEIVDNGKNGFVIEQNNKQQLGGKIIELMRNPDIRAKMGANGRKKAEEVYDVEVLANKWIGILESLVER